MNVRQCPVFVLSLSFLACKPAADTPATTPEPTEVAAQERSLEGAHLWQGSVALPTGEPLEFFVEVSLQKKEGKEIQRGTIDIPQQAVRALELSEVELTDGKVTFELADFNATWEAQLDGENVSKCTFEQNGATYECQMTPIDVETFKKLTALKRPQNPLGPFPYTTEEVGLKSPVDKAEIVGTLTLPEGTGPYPGVVLISGSGSQDRDGTMFGHKPLLVMSDHLARNGIASLRIDDRGVGGSASASPEGLTTKDLAMDFAAGVAALKAIPEIDKGKRGIIGHSEGALMAAIVAAEFPKEVSYVVLLAGPAVSGEEILLQQVKVLNEAGGAPAESTEEKVQLEKQIIQAAKKSDKKAIEELLTKASPDAPPELIEAKVAEATSPWFRHFVSYDPTKALSRVKVPVLALYGSLDLQVDPEMNTPVLEKALKKNNEVTVTVVPGLNHLFQTAEKGLPQEYATIEETFSPQVLTLVSDWIKGQGA